MRHRADWEVLPTVEKQRADFRLLTTCMMWPLSQGNEAMKHQVPAGKEVWTVWKARTTATGHQDATTGMDAQNIKSRANTANEVVRVHAPRPACAPRPREQ